MNENKQDSNLQAPQEANTTKHINFRNNEEVRAEGDHDTTIFREDESPTKKAWEELRKEFKDDDAPK